MFGSIGVSVSTDATPQQLRDRLDDLTDALDVAREHMVTTEMGWLKATDPVAVDRMNAFLAAARDYRVLLAWKDVVYAAFIFATDGADCAALDAHSTVS